jgi:hypothetical protein
MGDGAADLDAATKRGVAEMPAALSKLTVKLTFIGEAGARQPGDSASTFPMAGRIVVITSGFTT